MIVFCHSASVRSSNLRILYHAADASSDHEVRLEYEGLRQTNGSTMWCLEAFGDETRRLGAALR